MGLSATLPGSFTRIFGFSGFLTNSLESFDSCLLHVTTWGVWSSSENLHLFYKLRESYGERRLLYEAPGHLFQKFEVADLTSFIYLAILFGWDFHLHPSPSYVRSFVSHDEWFEFSSVDEQNLAEIKQSLKRSEIPLKCFQRPLSKTRTKRL